MIKTGWSDMTQELLSKVRNNLAQQEFMQRVYAWESVIQDAYGFD